MCMSTKLHVHVNEAFASCTTRARADLTFSSEASGSSNKAPVCLSIAQLTAAASTVKMSVKHNHVVHKP